MRLLVVEGNTKETWQHRESLGGIPYHRRFQTMLKILQPEAKVEFAFPADNDSMLNSRIQLASFDGVLWTGSSLSVNSSTPEVQRQLSFAEDVFHSGVPFYGSCWGLQIASVVAGGKVKPCEKGWEFGLSQPISLTSTGKIHPCFRGRTGLFSSLVVHRDEIVKLPENSMVLATNSHSKVQAISFRYRKSEFFGVQYHPEFTISDLGFIARVLSKNLIRDEVFKNEKRVQEFIKKMKNKISIPKSIFNYKTHILEVDYWLRSLR